MEVHASQIIEYHIMAYIIFIIVCLLKHHLPQQLTAYVSSIDDQKSSYNILSQQQSSQCVIPTCIIYASHTYNYATLSLCSWLSMMTSIKLRLCINSTWTWYINHHQHIMSHHRCMHHHIIVQSLITWTFNYVSITEYVFLSRCNCVKKIEHVTILCNACYIKHLLCKQYLFHQHFLQRILPYCSTEITPLTAHVFKSLSCQFLFMSSRVSPVKSCSCLQRYCHQLVTVVLFIDCYSVKSTQSINCCYIINLFSTTLNIYTSVSQRKYNFPVLEQISIQTPLQYTYHCKCTAFIVHTVHIIIQCSLHHCSCILHHIIISTSCIIITRILHHISVPIIIVCVLHASSTFSVHHYLTLAVHVLIIHLNFINIVGVST